MQLIQQNSFAQNQFYGLWYHRGHPPAWEFRIWVKNRKYQNKVNRSSGPKLLTTAFEVPASETAEFGKLFFLQNLRLGPEISQILAFPDSTGGGGTAF